MQDKKASIKFIEECYKLYEQKLYQVAYSILRDSGLAEDAVQEAFLKLMKSDTYFEDAKSEDCKRYIITIIKHSSINIYNKKRKEKEIIFLSNQDDIHVDTNSQVEVSESNSLEDLIGYLPSKYYAVVNCLVIKDLSVKETSRELGITESNVRKRFERAKMMLKAIVKGREEYETGRKLYQSGIY